MLIFSSFVYRADNNEEIRQDVTSCEHYELLINVNPNGLVLKILFDGANNNQRVNSSKVKACMEEFVDAAAMPM